MLIRRRRKTSIVFELEEWEVQQLVKILKRINGKDAIRKSEFSLPEKIIGRKLIVRLEPLINQPKEQ
jgi:hypothetical protein